MAQVRARRPLALLLLLAAGGLAVGLALAFRGGDPAPVDEASAAAAAPAPPPPPAATVEPQEPAAAAGGRGYELTYGDGARSVVFEPRLTARAYIAVDAGSGEILVARRERQRRPFASLTKIMTALLVIEDGELDRKVRVPVEATRVEPNREGLRKRRWYARRLLLWSALLGSANDSADTLAYAAGGGSLARFYRRMNERARELGMTDTTYRSASGLNDETNLSSARDQVLLVREALRNPLLARIVRTRTKRVRWPAPTHAREWVNHNKMLWTYEGTVGVKTGYTSKAGACLAVAVERGGHTVFAVVLGSRDIWADMPRLVDAAFERLAGSAATPAAA